MGHSFLTCDICNEPTHSDHTEYCDCSIVWCMACFQEYCIDEDCEEQYDRYEDDALANCPVCLDEMVTDAQMLEYLLQKSGMTRDQICEEILTKKAENKQ